MKVIIGTPIYRPGAYALEVFLSNQREIQERRANCELVFCTEDAGFMPELENMLRRFHLKGTVVPHKNEKPADTKTRIWSITSAREALRCYFMSRPDADGLLFLDADMTFDPDVVDIMEREIAGHDAVFSGYVLRDNEVALAGAGCFLIKRKAAEKIKFRCLEFKNGQHLTEDNLAELDLYMQRGHIKKGFFVSIDHYASWGEVRRITPRKASLWRRVTNSTVVRYCLLRASIALHYNLAKRGIEIAGQIRGIFRRMRERTPGYPQSSNPRE